MNRRSVLTTVVGIALGAVTGLALQPARDDGPAITVSALVEPVELCFQAPYGTDEIYITTPSALYRVKSQAAACEVYGPAHFLSDNGTAMLCRGTRCFKIIERSVR